MSPLRRMFRIPRRPPPVTPAGPSHTTDRNDPRLGHGVDAGPVPQHAAYLVLSDEERAKGFVRPVRTSYVHSRGGVACGTSTRMSLPIAETYAREPGFYGATYCVGCGRHVPVSQCTWEPFDGSVVGS